MFARILLTVGGVIVLVGSYFLSEVSLPAFTVKVKQFGSLIPSTWEGEKVQAALKPESPESGGTFKADAGHNVMSDGHGKMAETEVGQEFRPGLMETQVSNRGREPDLQEEVAIQRSPRDKIWCCSFDDRVNRGTSTEDLILKIDVDEVDLTSGFVPWKVTSWMKRDKSKKLEFNIMDQALKTMKYKGKAWTVPERINKYVVHGNIPHDGGQWKLAKIELDKPKPDCTFEDKECKAKYILQKNPYDSKVGQGAWPLLANKSGMMDRMKDSAEISRWCRPLKLTRWCCYADGDQEMNIVSRLDIDLRQGEEKIVYRQWKDYSMQVAQRFRLNEKHYHDQGKSDQWNDLEKEGAKSRIRNLENLIYGSDDAPEVLIGVPQQCAKPPEGTTAWRCDRQYQISMSISEEFEYGMAREWKVTQFDEYGKGHKSDPHPQNYICGLCDQQIECYD